MPDAYTAVIVETLLGTALHRCRQEESQGLGDCRPIEVIVVAVEKIMHEATSRICCGESATSLPAFACLARAIIVPWIVPSVKT
jgi:hypothetical protein